LQGIRSHRNPNGPVGDPRDDGKDLFAMVLVDEIAFTKGASEKNLYGIHGAGIRFHNGCQFLILGARHPQMGLRNLGRAVSNK
jgi:hypothetical protein